MDKPSKNKEITIHRPEKQSQHKSKAGSKSHRMLARMAAISALMLIVSVLVGCSGGPSSQNKQANTAGKANTPTAKVQIVKVQITATSLPTSTPKPTAQAAQAQIATATDPPAEEPPVPSDTPISKDEPKPTDTRPPAPSKIAWKMNNFLQTSSGCKFSGVDCYQGTSGDKVLTTSNSIYVDPSWSNPKLVFWHKYNFPGKSQAYISIGVNGSWTPIKYWAGTSLWKETIVSLEEFSGETIDVQFFAPFGILEITQKCEKAGHDGSKVCTDVQKITNSDWIIQNIELDPG